MLLSLQERSFCICSGIIYAIVWGRKIQSFEALAVFVRICACINFYMYKKTFCVLFSKGAFQMLITLLHYKNLSITGKVKHTFIQWIRFGYKTRIVRFRC